MGTEPQATWAEEISKVKPSVGEDAERLSAIIVEPETQLSIGKWRLTIAETLSNTSGINQIATGDDIQLGEIKPFEVREVKAHTPFDSDYYIDVDFNKRLLPPTTDEMTKEMIEAFAQKLAPFVTIRRSSLGQKLASVVQAVYKRQEQVRETGVKQVALTDAAAAEKARALLPADVVLHTGTQGLVDLVNESDADMVLVAIVLSLIHIFPARRSR